MKKIIFAAVLLIFAFSAEAQLKWSDHSVHTLAKGRKEIGLFAPLKYGLKDSLELSVHPIFFFVIPHITVKKYWKSVGSWELGSTHGFAYPNLLYKLISRRGTGGILPENAKIPQLFKFNNSVSLGKSLNQHLDLTFTAGLDLTIALGEGSFPEIEFPIVYPRTYSHNQLITPYLGAHLSGELTGKLQYAYDGTAFFFVRENKGLNLENNLRLQWNASNKLAFRVGLVHSYGTYPFGKMGRLYPYFDVLFGF